MPDITQEVAARDTNAVLGFASIMLAKMRAHSHYPGDWYTWSLIALVQRAEDEMVELKGAVARLETDTTNPDYVEAFVKECADVANFVMMAADNVREWSVGECKLGAW